MAPKQGLGGNGFGDLRRRLEKIEVEIGGKKKAVKGKGPVDKVKAKHEEVSQRVMGTRQKIATRDKRDPSSVEYVQLSKEIRDDIRDVRIMHSDMADIVRKENHKNLKKQGKNDASIKKRQEIVDIVGLHIKEIEQLEKGRGHLKDGKDFDSKDSGMGSGGGGGGGKEANPLMGGGTMSNEDLERTQSTGVVSIADALKSDLPDIETRQIYEQMQKNDVEIDRNLDQISEGLVEVKELAQEMAHQIDVQGVMINDLENTMDKANDGVRSLNKRMGSALKQIRGGDKVCLDLICLVVVLAIGLYLYNMINSPSSGGGGGGGFLLGRGK